VDTASNPDASPASHTWTVDTTAPDTTITSAPADPSSNSSATFEFTGSDAGTGVASYECRLDGGAWGACASSYQLTGLSTGGHTFEVRAIDSAGNVDATPATHNWTITVETGKEIYLPLVMRPPSITTTYRHLGR
jgi:hypothetical protein